jgi:long-subunit fatty acid transport protein
MKNSKTLLFLIVSYFMLVATTNNSNAQTVDDNKDFAFWSSVGVKYSLGKKWKFSLAQNLRMKEQASEVDEYFTELGIKYELFKDFEIGVGLRHITENDNQGKKQGFENYFRYNIDLSYKYDVHRFGLSHRLRYQNKNQLGISVIDGDIPGENLRFKTSLDYNIRKWPLDPEFSVELFNSFKDGQQMRMNKYRLTLGTEYKWKKVGEFGIYYRFEESVITNSPNSLSIAGFKYTYSIN